MDNFKIKTRFSTGFGLMLLLIAVLAVLSLWRWQEAPDATTEITGQHPAVERSFAQWKGLKQAPYRDARAAAIGARNRDDIKAANQFFNHDIKKLLATYNNGVGVLAGALVLLIGLFLALVITRSITRSIARSRRRSVQYAKAVPSHDLAHRIKAKGTGQANDELLNTLRQINTDILGIAKRAHY